MAAAIILIPEMLSGPDRESRETTAQLPKDEPAIKTYTIDLNRPPGTPAASNVVEEAAAPPPEQPSEQIAPAEKPSPAATTPAEPVQANPEPRADKPRADSTTQRSTAAETRTSEPPKPPAPETQREKPPTQPSPQERTASARAPEQSVPTTRGWAVQLGSFSSRASADRLAAEIRGSGHDVFVMPVDTGRSTLYRVRVGPFRDRAAADQTLGRLRSKVPGAAVVAHP